MAGIGNNHHNHHGHAHIHGHIANPLDEKLMKIIKENLVSLPNLSYHKLTNL